MRPGPSDVCEDCFSHAPAATNAALDGSRLASLKTVEPARVRGLLQADDVMPWLLARRLSAEKCALVTVIGVDGGAPRSVGAQMAVSESGRYVGYLSGGCLEQSVALEALAAIRGRRNRLVRYGKDSPYLDIRLPCGAALDVYIDQSLDVRLVEQVLALRDRRSLVGLRTNLESGVSELVGLRSLGVGAPRSRRDAQTFTRVNVPPLKMQLIGSGPSVAAIAQLAVSAGITVEAASPDDGTRAELELAGIRAEAMVDAAPPARFHPDRWTAAVLAFHEHEWEPPVLKELLSAPCFYIGALGSRIVHARRLQILADEGVREADRARIRGPIGLVPGAKGRASLAIGALAEIMAEAKANNFVM